MILSVFSFMSNHFMIIIAETRENINDLMIYAVYKENKKDLHNHPV